MNDNDTNLIIKFLENDLNDREVDEFKSKYGHNAEFTHEVNEQAKIHIAFEAAARINAEQEHHDLVFQSGNLAEVEKTKSRFTINTGWTLRIAAGVMALIGLSIGINFLIKPGLSTDDLFSLYYKNTTISEDSRSFAGEQNGAYMQFLQESDAEIDEYLKDFPSPAEIHKFALFLMDQKRFTAAASAFKQILDNNDKNFQESSQWYLGLCYLKLVEIDKAKRVFQSIVNNPLHEFYGNSKKILKKIN
jgi:tetratricopeptide (TPR) repeat protein